MPASAAATAIGRRELRSGVPFIASQSCYAQARFREVAPDAVWGFGRCRRCGVELRAICGTAIKEPLTAPAGSGNRSGGEGGVADRAWREAGSPRDFYISFKWLDGRDAFFPSPLRSTVRRTGPFFSLPPCGGGPGRGVQRQRCLV